MRKNTILIITVVLCLMSIPIACNEKTIYACDGPAYYLVIVNSYCVNNFIYTVDIDIETNDIEIRLDAASKVVIGVGLLNESGDAVSEVDKIIVEKAEREKPVIRKLKATEKGAFYVVWLIGTMSQNELICRIDTIMAEQWRLANAYHMMSEDMWIAEVTRSYQE